MIAIGDILVSDDVVEKKFVCQLDKCKGACCWEGDFGAPLEKNELPILDQIMPIVLDNLPGKSKKTLQSAPAYIWYEEPETFGTSLNKDGSCVFLNFDDQQQGYCTFEKLWKEGKSNFRKPLSCHLYPIRVEKNEHTGFVALNYDNWEICGDACKAGEALNVPVYQFLKEPLIRAFGEEFYEALDQSALYIQSKKG